MDVVTSTSGLFLPLNRNGSLLTHVLWKWTYLFDLEICDLTELFLLVFELCRQKASSNYK